MARGSIPPVSAFLVLSPYETEDEPVPHPELVRVQRPTVSQVMQAAVTLGVFPDGSYLAGRLRLG